MPNASSNNQTYGTWIQTKVWVPEILSFEIISGGLSSRSPPTLALVCLFVYFYLLSNPQRSKESFTQRVAPLSSPADYIYNNIPPTRTPSLVWSADHPTSLPHPLKEILHTGHINKRGIHPHPHMKSLLLM